MRNFLLIAQGVMWGHSTVHWPRTQNVGMATQRENSLGVHMRMWMIFFLRFQALLGDMASIQAEPTTVPCSGLDCPPAGSTDVSWIWLAGGGVQLGRVMITRLAPGKQVAPTKTRAPMPPMFRDTLALQCGPGNVDISGTWRHRGPRLCGGPLACQGQPRDHDST